MSEVSRCEVTIHEKIDDCSVHIYYRRRAPWGENCSVGQRIGLRELSMTRQAEMRERMIYMAHEAGRMMDRQIEKKQSDRIKKGLDAPPRTVTMEDLMSGRVTDPYGSPSFIPSVIDPAETFAKPSWFPRIPAKEPAKKTPVTDATITRLKETMIMDEFDPGEFDDLTLPDGFLDAPTPKTAKTATEKFDAIKLAIAEANHDLMTSEVGMSHECQVWAAALYDDFTPGRLISEEDYVFDRLIYSEKLDRIVALLRPEASGARGFAITPELMEDTFPVLAINIDAAIVRVSEFESWAALDKAARKLINGRDAFKRAMSEAAYSAMGAAVAAKEAVKKEAEGSFYEANPLYGML